MLEFLQRILRQPEYIHALINPLPLYGLAVAWVSLIGGLALRSRAAQMTGLAVVLLSAASAWPAFEYGEQAYDRVYVMADADGQAWLGEHQARAERFIYWFYALAGLSAIAIAAPAKWPRAARPLVIATLLLGLVNLGLGVSIGYAGGKIRHREFRNERPPAKTSHDVDR